MTLKLPLTYEPTMGRILDSEGEPVCMVYGTHKAEKARSILTAVNAHEELLAVLASVHFHLQELRVAWERGAISEHDGLGGPHSNRNVDCEVQVRAAIAKARRSADSPQARYGQG